METIEISERICIREDLPSRPLQIRHEYVLHGKRFDRVHQEDLNAPWKTVLESARHYASKGLPPALKPQFVPA